MNKQIELPPVNTIFNSISEYDLEEELENIDINDFTEESGESDYAQFVDLLNVYTCYYKQLHEKKQDATLFDNIDYEKEESTNKSLEFLYEEMFKLKNSNEIDKDLLYEPNDIEVDINKWNEMYALYINDEQKYVCKFLLPLLNYISKSDWTKLNWNIKPFKK